LLCPAGDDVSVRKTTLAFATSFVRRVPQCMHMHMRMCMCMHSMRMHMHMYMLHMCKEGKYQIRVCLQALKRIR